MSSITGVETRYGKVQPRSSLMASLVEMATVAGRLCFAIGRLSAHEVPQLLFISEARDCVSECQR
jgi:hypothetical protein